MSEAAPSPESSSLPAEYFDDLYQKSSDPWSFQTSPYEAGKYAATLAALPLPLYPAAFEAGCSIGVLTEQLAARCGQLLSVDVAENALEQARTRCAGHDNVRFERCQLPAEFPEAFFDLILISEVGYYLSMPDLLILHEKCVTHLQPAGQLLLVHWTPYVHEYPLTGDQVHETFLARIGPELLHLSGAREEHYRLDLFEKR